MSDGETRIGRNGEDSDKERWVSSRLEKVKWVVEIVAATIVGVMAVIVSCKANAIAKDANRIASKTNELVERELAAQFAITTDFPYDIEAEFKTEDIVQVDNVGGNLKELKSLDYAVVLEVEFQAEGDNEVELAYVPIREYYTNVALTGKLSGRVATLRGRRNNAIFRQLQAAVIEQGQVRAGTANLYRHRYVRLRYSDNVSEKQVCYEVKPDEYAASYDMTKCMKVIGQTNDASARQFNTLTSTMLLKQIEDGRGATP